MPTKFLRRRDDGFVISHPGEGFNGHKDFEEFEVPDGENPQPPEFLSDADKGVTDGDEYVQVDAKGRAKGPRKAAAE